jgi:hypothetical protein
VASAPNTTASFYLPELFRSGTFASRTDGELLEQFSSRRSDGDETAELAFATWWANTARWCCASVGRSSPTATRPRTPIKRRFWYWPPKPRRSGERPRSRRGCTELRCARRLGRGRKLYDGNIEQMRRRSDETLRSGRMVDPGQVERRDLAIKRESWGRDYTERLNKFDLTSLEHEAEQLYERLNKDFGEIPLPRRVPGPTGALLLSVVPRRTGRQHSFTCGSSENWGSAALRRESKSLTWTVVR